MPELFDVLFTDEAERDIEAIHAYLAKNGALEAADRLVETILDRIGALERFPHRGSVPPEVAATGFAGFRQIVAGNYRLIYRVVEQQAIITLIVDGRRDVASVLEERLVRN